MINNLRALQEGKLDEVENGMLYPLLRWCSGSEANLPHCSLVNKYLFFIPSEISKGFLSLGLKYRGMLKYPKSKIEEDEKYRIVKDYVKSIYGWSEMECRKNKRIIEILLNSSSFINELCRLCGFDASERKMFGLDIIRKDANEI